MLLVYFDLSSVWKAPRMEPSAVVRLLVLQFILSFCALRFSRFLFVKNLFGIMSSAELIGASISAGDMVGSSASKVELVIVLCSGAGGMWNSLSIWFAMMLIECLISLGIYPLIMKSIRGFT